MTRVYTLQGCWDVKGRILYMADKNDKGVYSKWLFGWTREYTLQGCWDVQKAYTPIRLLGWSF